ncbi:ABC transporter permease subunit [Crocinitomix catalasitica]|nr:ABC transporter permease subunit [Crocinitomix catalasitica]
MNSNLYFKELKRNRKNLITWSLIVIGFTFMVLSLYPHMSGMGDEMTKMMSKLPAELSKAFGLDENTWQSILGFYSTYYGIYIVVLMGIYTASAAATILSKEERDGTSEFLLSKPISRKNIYSTKLLVLLTLILIIYFLQMFAALIGFSVFSETTLDWNTLLVMHAHGFILVAFFSCCGMLISFFFRPKKNFMGMVVGIVFGTYFLSAMGKSADSISWIGYFSPFHYLDITANSSNSVNYSGGLCILVLGAGMLYFGYLLFKRKDLRA